MKIKMLSSFLKNMNIKMIFLICLIVGILIRASRLNYFLWGDEYFFVLHVYNFLNYGFFTFSIHPPLGEFFYIISSSILGLNIFAFRLVPFAFGLVTIILTFIFANKLFDKNVAYISTIMLLLSRLHIEATNRIDLDGAILTTFNLLFMFFIWQFLNKKRFYKKMILANIFLLASVLIKVQGILIIIPSLLFSVLNKRKTLILLVSSILTIFVGIGINILIASRVTEYSSTFLSSALDPLFKARYLLLLSWSLSIPFTFLLLIFLLKNSSKAQDFLKFWILIFLIIYFIVGKGDIPRYISVILPAISIFFASYLIKLKLRSLNSIMIGALSIIPLFALGITDKIWNFSLMLTFIPYIFPFLLFILWFIKRKQIKFSNIFILILFFSGLFYNIYFIFLDEPTIFSKIDEQIANYYISQHDGKHLVTNDVSLCWNLQLFYNKTCDASFRLVEPIYKDADNIAIVNIYRANDDIKKYPVRDDAIEFIEEKYILEKTFKFWNNEYAWFFTRK